MVDGTVFDPFAPSGRGSHRLWGADPMHYFVLSPEVAGGLGKNTLMSTVEHPPSVSRLHYELDGWLGDDLLESFPCFVVTSRLAHSLRHAGLSGVDLREVEITTSEQFRELYPDRRIPVFAWLHIVGKSGRDDFGADAEGRLVVSERALRLLENFTLDNCDVSEYP